MQIDIFSLYILKHFSFGEVGVGGGCFQVSTLFFCSITPPLHNAKGGQKKILVGINL